MSKPIWERRYSWLIAPAILGVAALVTVLALRAEIGPPPTTAEQVAKEKHALEEAWDDWANLKRGDLLILEDGRIQAVNYLEPVAIHLYDFFGAPSVAGEDFTVVETRRMKVTRIIRVGEPGWGAEMEKFVTQEPTP